LCLQVKREASQHQSHQSASGWGLGLRKLLCRGAACSSVISPGPTSVMETPHCPAITPDPAEDDKGTGVIHKDIQAGKEDGQEQRNPRSAEIRSNEDVEQNTCKLAISGVTFPRRDTACEEEMCLVLKPHGETAGNQPINPIPASSRDTACGPTQTIPAGQNCAMIAQSPHCSETDLETGSSCGDAALPSKLFTTTLQRTRTAGKRKGRFSEPVVPKKKRRRGRRQLRRFMNVLMKRQERAQASLTFNLSGGADCCFQELRSTDCHSLCRTQSLCHNSITEEETCSCSSNNLHNSCCCDVSTSSRGAANGCSQLNFDHSEGLTQPPDCHTCNTQTRHCQGTEKSISDDERNSAACCDHSAKSVRGCHIGMVDQNPESTLNKIDPLVCVQPVGSWYEYTAEARFPWQKSVEAPVLHFKPKICFQGEF
ncbi:hypothetical protein XENOCAPTIV_007355, partial [Xenoophorus captivus]